MVIFSYFRYLIFLVWGLSVAFYAASVNDGLTQGHARVGNLYFDFGVHGAQIMKHAVLNGYNFFLIFIFIFNKRSVLMFLKKIRY